MLGLGFCFFCPSPTSVCTKHCVTAILSSIFYKNSCFLSKFLFYPDISSSCNTTLTEIRLCCSRRSIPIDYFDHIKMQFSIKIVLSLFLLYSSYSEALPVAQGGAIANPCVIDGSCNFKRDFEMDVSYSVSMKGLFLSPDHSNMVTLA